MGLGHLPGALQGLLLGRVGLDASVVAVVVIGAVVSLVNMLRASTAIYFDALAMFVALLLAGRVVLMLTQEAVRRRSQQTSSMLPLVVRPGPDQEWIVTDHPAGSGNVSYCGRDLGG